MRPIASDSAVLCSEKHGRLVSCLHVLFRYEFVVMFFVEWNAKQQHCEIVKGPVANQNSTGDLTSMNVIFADM